MRLVFFLKNRFHGFISKIGKSLGRNFIFFLNSLPTTKISRSFKLSVYINVVLLSTFQNNLNYSSASNTVKTGFLRISGVVLKIE